MKLSDMPLFRWGYSLAPLLLLAVGCGSSSDDEAPPPQTTSGGAPSAAPPTSPAPTQPAPPAIPPETVMAVTDAIMMVTDQLQAACGGAFDTCSTTPGCNEILACAARNACTGSACYCTDASCQTPGPCRSVIEGAPGARPPDAQNDSLGPAADAAGAVGECLVGLGGGGGIPSLPTPAPTSTADAGSTSEAPDAG